jgi:DNA-binding NarL/FixJ family response regulator
MISRRLPPKKIDASVCKLRLGLITFIDMRVIETPLRRVETWSPTVDNQSLTAVAIIDSYDVVHAGIESWLTRSQPCIKVVANCRTPGEFLAGYQIGRSSVDVVLFALQYDGRAPEFGSLRLLCRAGHRVIVYSHPVSDEIILTSLDCGAIGYVAKSESGRHLCEAILSASSATPYVAPRMAQALLNDTTVGRPKLSRREREVLIAWCQTESKEEVAKRLFVQPSTVSTHLQRARAKYASVGRPASTKAALIARAIQDGFLGLDDL